MNANGNIRAALILATLALSASAASLGLASPVTYTFEGLTVGSPLTGQDSWALNSANPAVVTYGVGLNTSKTATLSASPASIMQRNIAFAPFSDTDTAAIMQFDMRWGNQGSSIRFGSGPWFGLTGIGPAAQLYVRDCTDAEWGTGNLGNVSNGDWVRFRLVSDFTANGNQGSGTLYYQNLTKGDASFSLAGTPLQNLNLKISPSSLPSSWTNVQFRIDYDNSANPIQIDNLVGNSRELTPYVQSVVSSNPVAYWRLNESAGNSGPYDQVAGLVRGSYGGGETYGILPGALPSEPGNPALGYRGTAGTFSTGTSLGQSLFGGQSKMTVEFWVRPNEAQTWSGLMLAEYGISDFSLESSSLNPNWYINGSTLIGQVPLTEDKFQLVDLVYDGVAGTARAYVDGQLVLSKVGLPLVPITNKVASFTLGRRAGSAYAIPNVDYQDLAIYQAALSADQIYAHYYAGIHVPEPSSWLLLAAGALAFAPRWRRRR
jgi:hypothetical protein